jgi:hypothetical protein
MTWGTLEVSGVEDHPAHWIRLEKLLTAASMSAVVLSEMFRDKFSAMSRRKESQFVLLLERLGWGTRNKVSWDSVMRIGVWSEESSKQDLADRRLGEMPLVTQKFIKSGSLFRSMGQYVGSPIERGA